MRVTFFHYIHNSPSTLVQVNEFAQAFRALGHGLTVHALDERRESLLRDRVKTGMKPFVKRFLHEFNSLRKNWVHYPRECRIIERERPDLILCRYKLYYNSAASVARRFRLPLILWVDAPASYEQRRYLKEFLQIPGLAERMEESLIRKADRAVVVSEEAKQYLAGKNRWNGALEVVPNGVDPDKFCPSREAGALRNHFPIKDPVILGFVGSFAPWHGIEGLKSLMAFALKAYPQTCLLLVGDGPHRSEMERFVQKGNWDPGRVWFTGQVNHEEIPTYLSAMDLCLLPYDSWRGGFYFSPLKLFEYMACGKPVLAAGIGQIKEIIQDGTNGFLYDVKDQRECLGKLKRLIEEESIRKRLGEKARQTVLERYTWRHTALRFEQIFQRVLESRGRVR